MRRPLVALLLLLGLAAPAVAGDPVRVDLFNLKSNRTGSVTIDERTGRIDTYDVRSNRTGYGVIDRATGRVDLYTPGGQRTGSGTITPSGGIREQR